MNKENVSKLWKIIQEADDYLLGEFYLASSHQQQATGTLIRDQGHTPQTCRDTAPGVKSFYQQYESIK